jgi:hypothetical protein
VRLGAALLAAVAALALAGIASAGGDPWAAAAAKLSMPVLAPSATPGMTLKRVVAHDVDCGPIQEELEAYYGAGEAKKLTILEGKPTYCGDIGDARMLGTYRVHGKKATLYAYCQGRGCRKATHAYDLVWREQGIQIQLISRGTPRDGLLRIARGMERVEG